MLLRMFFLPLIVLASALLVVACGDDDDSSTPSPTAVATETAPADPSATPPADDAETPPAATATPPATSGAPAAPSGLQIEGELPDLNTPVPPGQGELGRITLSWQDNSDNEDGFRIFQECEGEVSTLADVPADTTSQGPLGACRPGRVGVAAFNAQGISEIVWSS